MRTIDQTNAAQGGYQVARQLFVTRSRVLAQHVEATYQGLVEFTNIALKSPIELKEMAKQSREDPDRALVEFDSEIDLRNDLPERFSDIQDSHFPLFISFDKLCSLLEADIRHILPGQIGSSTSRILIGYDDFLHSYWPSFRGLAQSLEPNLVYSEIIGVIKGSQAAFESKEGYLTRHEYVNTLSRRQFPLLANVRDKVYSIFEIYTKNKTARRETDVADRTRLILRHIRQTIGESKVDYLYVDEVQDNLMIDIHLLRNLAKSIENIYWSGDSAQTVVAGSAFRINDLKAFTYRDQASSSVANTPRKAAAQFTTFELNVNFRSLSGIVGFAGYVVQAIHGLFPESIDPMEPEKAKQYGDPPILFTDIRDQVGYFEKFLLGSSASNRVVFGAQQAILVRDAEAAEQLDARLQGLCNVLPIMDSKGLEFDDVLIYNFFSQSAAPPSAWDHLLGNARGNQAPPPVLCSELKLLYVAMTRARRRCWIWDSGELVSRLKTQWISRDLIKAELSSQMIGRLASERITYFVGEWKAERRTTATSNKSEWVAKGREYFSHRLYKLAAACFRQADQPNDAKLSTAYHLMTRAKLKRLRGDSPAVRVDLIAAAVELEDCATLPGIGNKANVYYHAATCYESARDWLRASAAFVRAGRHTHGVQILFDARDFTHGAKVLVDNREHIDKQTFESLREQARQYFFSRHEYRQLGPLFDSVDDKITYARDRGYKVQLKRILDEHKRYDELASEYLDEDDLDRGVEYYVMAYQHHRTDSSIKRAVNLSLEYIESLVLIEGIYRKTSQDLARSLVSMIQPFAGQTDSESCLAVDLFYAHLVLNQVNLDLVKAWDQGDARSKGPRHTLARYLALKDNSWLHDDFVDVVLEHLEAWDLLIADIMGMVNGSDQSTSKVAQKLLGFSPDTSTGKTPTFNVSESSLIHHSTNKSADDDELGISARTINSTIREELPKRVYRLLDSMHTAALASPWVLPRRIKTSPLVPSSHLHSPNKITTSSLYSAPKLQVICKILQVLDLSNTSLRRFSDHTTTDQLWLRRMFGIICSATGEVQSLTVLSTASDSAAIAKCLPDWLRRDQNQLRKAEASDTSITHALIHMLVRSAVYYEFLEERGVSVTPIGPVQNTSFDLEVIRPLQSFLFSHNYDRLATATTFLGWIINQNYRVDAAAIVHLVEVLTRESIIQMRNAGFEALFMPFSWVMALAHKYSSSTPSRGAIEHLRKFLSIIEQLSLGLRFGLPVVGGMDDSAENAAPAFDSLKRLSSDDMPPSYRHRHSTSAGIYHQFSNVANRESVLRALCQTFRHESLVLVLESSSRYHPAKGVLGVCEIICSTSSNLLEKMERMVRGESPDSSDEESEPDGGFWEQEEYMDPEPSDYGDEDNEDEDDPDRYPSEEEGEGDEAWRYRY
ncbi:hypothetical protein FRC10_011007 [Ceratobasidium sp. 414]|nr:hypothetical protein FRC10_011007 [Ceratobasidium sp. 414]